MVERHPSICLPNYTPLKWWECDVFELTKSGYMREYEIKMSRSDFRADKKKESVKWKLDGDNWKQSVGQKHAEIGQAHGPTRFYFVAPIGIIPIDEVPAWAGFIECEWRGGKGPWNVGLNYLKQAPQLHRIKADAKIEQTIFRTAYYRYQTLFAHRSKQADDLDESNPLQTPPQIVIDTKT